MYTHAKKHFFPDELRRIAEEQRIAKAKAEAEERERQRLLEEQEKARRIAEEQRRIAAEKERLETEYLPLGREITFSVYDTSVEDSSLVLVLKSNFGRIITVAINFADKEIPDKTERLLFDCLKFNKNITDFQKETDLIGAEVNLVLKMNTVRDFESNKFFNSFIAEVKHIEQDKIALWDECLSRLLI